MPVMNVPAISRGRIFLARSHVSPKKTLFSSPEKNLLRTKADANTKAATIVHFSANGSDDVAERSTPIRSIKNNIDLCLRPPGSAGASFAFTAVAAVALLGSASHFFGHLSNMAAMIRPMTTAIKIAATALAMPRSRPSTRAVRTMASRLMAGPENKKAVAGPMPAPFFSMPANMGRMVQLQTARMVPEVAATL
ncbi:Uncharacterised protein [uncultured archaeon]|nr:Uncharacterised protein [uncultured archaeon]